MIFISSSCIKTAKIYDAVYTLANSGFKNIELSGGTQYYQHIESDLMNLKEKFELTYLIHNYFPPPQKHFVLNLASLNDKIYQSSIDHYIKSIELGRKLGCTKYGIHAGYLIDPSVDELGKKIPSYKVNDRHDALDRFCEGYLKLINFSNGIDVYIENNVLSYQNLETFGVNPLLFTTHESFVELSNRINFPILLDLAHLKVSCNTQVVDFEIELSKLLPLSDYIHISDNDGLKDSNMGLMVGSRMHDLLKGVDLSNKTITLEIYEDIETIISSFELIKSISSI